METLVYSIPLLPLVGFTVLSFSKGVLDYFENGKRIAGIFASAMVGVPFVIACVLGVDMMTSSLQPSTYTLFSWIQAGDFSIEYAFKLDQLSLLFTLVVTGVGFLIHVYSIGYMAHDEGFIRFFAYLNLFIFMMLNLVLADNYVVTFLGWEGVGLASFLLIGFWYDREFAGTNIAWTSDAARKAFIVNRIGDFGILLAIFMLYFLFGSLRYDDVNAAALTARAQGLFPNGSVYNAGTMTALALLLFLGCTGKSAQIPLFVWLPDAMAGPTPVSALIHAATMVTSGIFLIARTAPLFALSHDAMSTVAIIGVVTALLAATIGIVQNDIKKVLAYSTVSQLGFMVAALGVGAYTAAVFHVVTHAFFKACLFLGAGSVIHGMHEEQDIQKMGGLATYMPTTRRTFIIAALAIAGIFPFAGFFSKDEILWNVFLHGSPVLWFLLALAAFCTAFYIFRLVYLVFYGAERFDTHHTQPHESPAVMAIPLIVLAILSIIGGFLGIPHALGKILHIPNVLEQWLDPVFAPAQRILAHTETHASSHILEYVLMIVSLGIALAGVLLARSWYATTSETPQALAQRMVSLYNLLWNKYFVDEIYYKLLVNPLHKFAEQFVWKGVETHGIDMVVNRSGSFVMALAEIIRRIQSGVAQNYALLLLMGIILVMAWLLLS
ncbi:MAG: NADH-quinone oxidoreductase subunit L [Bacteroidota bacterium]|nr:NADH-quinone oxidoreductase subunit L [Candidatus Kapabacteria bacterium]MDW8219575.1 NADH-quinone oxidoreductase subunit L [Bacteroidota bacterium]